MSSFGPYPALVVGVHDGDTLNLDIDLGFDHLISALDFDGKTRLSCRIKGINAPELSSAEGVAARAYALELLPLGSRCTIVSHGWDKYGGRFDGSVTLSDGTDFGQRMLEAGQAVAYP